MKKTSKKYIFIILFFILIFLILMFKSKYFLNGKYEIYSIKIKDGSNGKVFVIDDKNTVAYISEIIKMQKFRKSAICFFNMGYLYRMEFFDKNGKKVESLILNSDDTIRKRLFFYRTTPEMIGICEYIKDIERKY